MLKLYSYFRSSAAYRVRIALNLKGLAYEIVPVHLVRDGGQHKTADYRAVNPQQRVPALRRIRVVRWPLEWRPNLAGAVFVGVLAALACLSLRHVSEFLYFKY